MRAKTGNVGDHVVYICLDDCDTGLGGTETKSTIALEARAFDFFFYVLSRSALICIKSGEEQQ